MQINALQGAVAGAVAAGAIVAFVVRPVALSPHPPASPSLENAVAVPSPPRAGAADRTGDIRPQNVVVYVAGAVAHPGVYAVANSARAIDAVAKAGGLTHDADAVAVNLAAHVADGDEIAVPRIGESVAAPAGASTSQRRSGKRSRHARKHRRSRHAATTYASGDPSPSDGTTSDAATSLVDINTADATTLATVPGIGETLADRIVEFRRVNGPFASVDALADVSGITPSRFDAIASFLTVGQP